MLTVMSEPLKTLASPPAKEPERKDQVRSDRKAAIVVVAIMAALVGLVIWLASMSGGGVPDGIDHWQFMP